MRIECFLLPSTTTTTTMGNKKKKRKKDDEILWCSMNLLSSSVSPERINKCNAPQYCHCFCHRKCCSLRLVTFLRWPKSQEPHCKSERSFFLSLKRKKLYFYGTKKFTCLLPIMINKLKVKVEVKRKLSKKTTSMRIVFNDRIWFKVSSVRQVLLLLLLNTHNCIFKLVYNESALGIVFSLADNHMNKEFLFSSLKQYSTFTLISTCYYNSEMKRNCFDIDIKTNRQFLLYKQTTLVIRIEIIISGKELLLMLVLKLIRTFQRINFELLTYLITTSKQTTNKEGYFFNIKTTIKKLHRITILEGRKSFHNVTAGRHYYFARLLLKKFR